MLQVHVDARKLEAHLRAAATRAIGKALRLGKKELASRASPLLHKTLAIYQKAIRIHQDEDGLQGTIRLHGTFPAMLERGFAPFDMKPGFLRSAKRKSSRRGAFLRVPINGKIRTVSWNSPAKSWLHPGFRGIRLMRPVAAVLRRQWPGIVRKELLREFRGG